MTNNNLNKSSLALIAILVSSQVLKDEQFQQALEEKTQEELKKITEEKQDGGGESAAAARYASVRKRVEARASKVLTDISSAMSNNVLR